MDFSEFGLDSRLQDGLKDCEYTVCTPVQEAVLKAALDGSNVYVQSQTGTGKTCAYILPILQEIMASRNGEGAKRSEDGQPQSISANEGTNPSYCEGEACTSGTVLILLPTRELAVQVTQEASALAAHTGLKAFCFYGGVGYDKQLAALKGGVDIIIGTPGRMIDLNEGGQLDLSHIKYLVIDEADRMFDMGFYPDLRTLLKVLPPPEARQTMLLSATLNTYVKNLAWEFTRDAKEITIQSENITVDRVDQELLHVSSDDKMKLLVGILTKKKPRSVLIFCNTKRTCEVVAKRLCINGLKAEFIIGDLPQQRRIAVLNKFKANVTAGVADASDDAVSILVATDVAARGIDVEDLAMVVNYDLPNEAENYVHRIGRTARALKSGVAYSFCSEQDVYNLPAIERYIDMSIPAQVAEACLMADDRSAGMYIKTEDWDSGERNDRHGHYGRDDKVMQPSSEAAVPNRGSIRPNGLLTNRRQTNRYRQGGKRTESRNVKYADKRGNNKESNRAAAPAQKRKDSQTIVVRFDKDTHKRMERPVINTKALANMSFEERMKVYKEKYRGKDRGVGRSDTPPRQSKRGGTGRLASSASHPVAQSGSLSLSNGLPPTCAATETKNVSTAAKGSPKPPLAVPPKKVPEVVPPAAEKKSLLARVRSLFGKKTRGK